MQWNTKPLISWIVSADSLLACPRVLSIKTPNTVYLINSNYGTNKYNLHSSLYFGKFYNTQTRLTSKLMLKYLTFINVIPNNFHIIVAVRVACVAGGIVGFSAHKQAAKRLVQFQLLKNSLVQINSKLNSKPYDYLY